MSVRCIITGCGLHDLAYDVYHHGDLFVLGDHTFIFNAVFDPDGPIVTEDICERHVVVDSNSWFERRGVIVFAVADARLSPAAQAYIGAAI